MERTKKGMRMNESSSLFDGYPFNGILKNLIMVFWIKCKLRLINGDKH